jgi:hypothetical protein
MTERGRGRSSARRTYKLVQVAERPALVVPVV